MENLKIEKYKHGNKVYRARVQQAAINPETVDPGSLPPGRVSVDESESLVKMIAELAGEFSAVDAKFPLEFLGVMQNLSMANPDVSQMVDNIVQLGNTGHNIIVNASTEAQQQRVLDEINRFTSTAFYKFGGVDGFVNAALGQIARSGAVSIEWVPMENLTAIERVVFVPTCQIRFIYDDNEQDNIPYQKVCQGTRTFNAKDPTGFVRLNTATYQYVGIQYLDNSPYAIPPILAALEPIMIQRDIMKNFRFIAKKMGLLGFVTFLLEAPKRNPGEKEDAYQSRMQAYLAQNSEPLKSNFRDGMAFGFKDTFEVEHHSLAGNAQGASEIHQRVEEQVFSGLKSDPALHGRTFSTTETYAGVVYEKMLSILSNYQRPIKGVLEYGIKLHLNLMGLEYDELFVEFEASQSLSAERDENTYATKIDTLIKLYDQGVIDQNQLAQEAGYDSPAEEEPRAPTVIALPPEDEEGEGEESNTARFKYNKALGKYFKIGRRRKKRLQYETLVIENPQEALAQAREELHKHFPECCPDHAHLQDTTSVEEVNEELQKFIDEYFAAVLPSIRNSSDEAIRAAIIEIQNLPLETLDSELFAESVLQVLTNRFGQAFGDSAVGSRIRAQVRKFYRFFRLDDFTPFGGVPAPVRPSLNLIDGNAVRFMRNSDNFYFGKYISDPQTQRSLKSWLEREFLKSGTSLRDRGELAKFRQRLGNRIQLEDYKVVRVVETSVSRAKNWGNALNANQSGATTLEIVGPNDNVTCPWCRAMIGKTYPVRPIVQQINDISSRDPEDLPQLSPFLPGKINPEVVKQQSADQLLAQGIALPPYHPHCRHRFVVTGFEDDDE